MSAEIIEAPITARRLKTEQDMEQYSVVTGITAGPDDTDVGQGIIWTDAYIYGILERFTGQDPTFWSYYKLSNGGVYTRPAAPDEGDVWGSDQPQRYTFKGMENGHEGEVSADAAGIIASIMAFSELSWRRTKGAVACGHAYHKLYEYIGRGSHPEAGEILHIIN